MTIPIKKLTPEELERIKDNSESHYPYDGLAAADIIKLRRHISALEAENGELKGRFNYGQDTQCYYCKKSINNLHGNPGEWGIPLCHSDEPGVVKYHHIKCVSERLIERDQLKRAIASILPQNRMHEFVQKLDAAGMGNKPGRGNCVTDMITELVEERDQLHAAQEKEHENYINEINRSEQLRAQVAAWNEMADALYVASSSDTCCDDWNILYKRYESLRQAQNHQQTYTPNQTILEWIGPVIALLEVLYRYLAPGLDGSPAELHFEEVKDTLNRLTAIKEKLEKGTST